MRSGPRQMMESLVCLALAVIVFRTFQLEGYMISTGSMAPHLLGFHKRVKCPTCQYRFATGISQNGEVVTAIDSSKEEQSSGGLSSLKPGRGGLKPTVARRYLAKCPNCGRDSINIRNIPRNQGDQLLVHKNAYEFGHPKRWEVIVFRNPAEPSQAYVKRVVGLPGETIQVLDGNLYVFQKERFVLCRKDLSLQHAMRIPVYDHDYEPVNDPTWKPRWVPESAEREWTAIHQGFTFHGLPGEQEQSTVPFAWVKYRHWIRFGGSHRTALKLEGVENDVRLSHASLHPLRYNPVTKTLSCIGVLPDKDRDRLLQVTEDPGFHQAVHRIHEQSHIAPVTDDYGYNRVPRSEPPTGTRELMVSAEVTVSRGQGRFILQMTDASRVFDCVIDVGRREVRLFVDGKQQSVRSARLKTAVLTHPMLWEMSLIDQQVLVAVNGQQAFGPLLLDNSRPSGEPPREPVRFGAEGLQVRVRSLKLYRDVYYTEKGSGHPCTLGRDEYYVLGDNSPVSSDSRVWSQPSIKRRFFLGKPFVVHLPSRPGRIKIGQTFVQIRIPDLSRIHYIR